MILILKQFASHHREWCLLFMFVVYGLYFYEIYSLYAQFLEFFFNHKWVLNVFKSFSAPIEIIRWFLFIYSLILCITLINLIVLKNPCIPMMNLTWSWCSIEFTSVTQSCSTLCKPMNCSTPGLPVHHQLLQSTQTNVHWVSDAIQPSHPLSSPSPPAFHLSQHRVF